VKRRKVRRNGPNRRGVWDDNGKEQRTNGRTDYSGLNWIGRKDERDEREAHADPEKVNPLTPLQQSYQEGPRKALLYIAARTRKATTTVKFAFFLLLSVPPSSSLLVIRCTPLMIHIPSKLLRAVAFREENTTVMRPAGAAVLS
jgi:hypothetical protein